MNHSLTGQKSSVTLSSLLSICTTLFILGVGDFAVLLLAHMMNLSMPAGATSFLGISGLAAFVSAYLEAEHAAYNGRNVPFLAIVMGSIGIIFMTLAILNFPTFV